jgi:hypothetical protein
MVWPMILLLDNITKTGTELVGERIETIGDKEGDKVCDLIGGIIFNLKRFMMIKMVKTITSTTK